MAIDNEQNERIIAQFTAQSKRFDSPDYSLSSEECLAWALERLPLQEDSHVIDVAAGTGLLSLAIGPYVRCVVAVDITQAMLDEGRKSAAAKNITNVTFRLGDAYHLGETDKYDIAVSRLAFHHLTQPEKMLNQMAKAVHPGGHVVVFDLLSPDDITVRTQYNTLERLRDNSHTTALTSNEMLGLFESCGLSDISVEYRRVINNLEAWMTMTETPEKNRNIIRKAMQHELEKGQKTGFDPFYGDNGAIMFSHKWIMIRGRKMKTP